MGTATEGADYTKSGSTETIAADASSDTISVPILPDEEVEGDETFMVTLSNAAGAKLLAIADDGTVSVADTISATGTISDDDALPVVSITADNGSVIEGDDLNTPVKANFELSATNLFGDSVTLTINATPDQGDLDFLMDDVSGEAADFAVEFTPDDDGIYTGNLSLDIVGDTDKEDSGEITVTLNATATYELGDTVTGEITVVDNDYEQHVLVLQLN